MSISTQEINKLAQDWLSIDPNPKSKSEIQQLLDAQDYTKLQAKLYPRIAFGTAGLRSSMESGFAHMNDVTVLQASQGFVSFLINKAQSNEIPSIVVGYDHRYHSQRYAELLASVALAKGLVVYYLGSVDHLSSESLALSGDKDAIAKFQFGANGANGGNGENGENNKYGEDGREVGGNAKDAALREYVHTPIVPYAIDELKASGGVMITASHNPAKDNGYKVYYSNGCQIIPPIDSEISDSIEENLIPWSKENVWDVVGNFKLGIENGKLKHVRTEIVQKYVDAVKHKLIKNHDLDFNFVYTPMHGVGLDVFEQCLKLFNLKQGYEVVAKQAVPDPAFPTVSFPNPEEKGALDLAMETAKAKGINLVVANDPDADRFSVAVVDKSGKFKQLTGNEIGFLFAMYVIETLPKEELKKTYLLNSTVSSQILKAMAARDGFHYADTLTGFKWVGNKAIDLEKEDYLVPFAYEEAIGFMFSLVHDKDGVSAAVTFLQLYQQWFANNTQNVFDKLEEGYQRYGWFKDFNGYYRVNDVSITGKIFQDIRDSYKGQEYPTEIGDFKVIDWRDLTIGYELSTRDHVPDLPVDSHSQMITAVLKPLDQYGKDADDRDLSVRFTCRGSGTEPKLKVYIEGKSTVSGSDAVGIADKCWEALKTYWFKPDHYHLQENKP
ncbi:hypothetical protein PVL30_003772 [Lodderomyces elongisporus]|uniref:uncharacterized protein n=1 Tax=Lodderomyces elongisporus TaxID=36914 RepID=UPI0029272A13|nr:uncharacterized protein PVL30_003772 [Lodderomyces elongisporus]WLF80004.1 hypothetical protein PVL30_003772 [Lodderomyces elongisporus]